MAQGQIKSDIFKLFSEVKRSLGDLNTVVQKHCDEDPEYVLTDFESKSLTYQRSVFTFLDGINGVLVWVLENAAWQQQLKKVENKYEGQDEIVNDLRRSTNTNFRNIEKDLENDFVSIDGLRRSLANLTQNRMGEGTFNMERNHQSNFKPKPPSFNNDLSESPVNFLNNMESYLRVVNLDQDELIYTIESCLGRNCKAWFNVIKDRIVDWDSFVVEFRNMFWNDTTKSEKRREIEFGKYDKNSRVSRVQYATNLMSAAKDAVDNFSEKDLCIAIRAHFERDVRIALRMGKVETLKDLVESLQEFDSGDKKEPTNNFRNNNSYNRPRNFRNNYSNFKPNFGGDNFGSSTVDSSQSKNSQDSVDNVKSSTVSNNVSNRGAMNSTRGNKRSTFNDRKTSSQENRYNLRSQNRQALNVIVQNEERDSPDVDNIENISSDECDSESENCA